MKRMKFVSAVAILTIVTGALAFTPSKRATHCLFQKNAAGQCPFIKTVIANPTGTQSATNAFIKVFDSDCQAGKFVDPLNCTSTAKRYDNEQ